MRLQAAKVDLLSRCPHQTAAVSSLLFDPSSRSLALMLSDASALLFPSFSASPSAPPPPPPTVVPPISTAACFLRLLPSAQVLFLSASPLASGASVLLRAWIAQPIPRFSPAKLSFRNQLCRSAVALDLPHGLSVRLASSVNFFVVHSLVAGQIWVLAAKPEGDAEDVINIVKCAVVELTLPVYSVAMSNGFLLLGEVNGVRVFPLRPLIKGRKFKKGVAFGTTKASSAGSEVDLQRKKLPNGVAVHNVHDETTFAVSESGGCCDSKGCRAEDAAKEKADGCSQKLRTIKLRQTSCDNFSFFVTMERVKVHNSGSDTRPLTSLQAVSVHLISQKKFLILDSTGYLHVLTLPSMAVSSEMNAHFSMISKCAHLHHLDHTMKVELLAVLPDVSSKAHFIWISDGEYSMHIMPVADIECPGSEVDKDESKEKAMDIPAVEAIFTSEKIQEIIPLSGDSILVHCQGGIYTYVVA